jgi:hypothetical protein
MGPSGSGKTYSALQIAKGLGGRIAMIDTERGSGSLYSHLAEFDVAELVPPFEPQKYVEAILAAEKAGYDVLIIDSLSHAWSGPGGVLDIHDRVTKSVRNSFTAWREVTPAHNALVDAMLASACHVIVTLRTKTAYEVVTEGGKTKVSKVGLAPQQREGLEYEFTVVFDLSIDGHVASATKDRSGLFDGQYFTPGVEIGTRLLEWLHTGRPAAPKEKSPVAVGVEGLSGRNSGQEEAPRPFGAVMRGEQKNGFLLDHLDAMLNQLGLGPHAEAYHTYVCERYGVEGIGDLEAKQLAEQLNLLRQCKAREEKMAQFMEILEQHKKAA